MRFLGDEPELYLQFNRILMTSVFRAVAGEREDIEDACAFAWVQFLRYQPDRDRNWQGWLFRTAQHEAWRLTAIRGNERHLTLELSDRDADDPSGGLDPAWRLERREDLREAVDELKRMPKAMREVVFVHSQVPLHSEVADILGVPQNRVAYLLASAGAEVRERAVKRTARERPVASPRASRLRELEDDPPEWLIEAAGRPPAKGKNASASILAWRRAALAIDDYRTEHGWISPLEGLGPTPTDDLVARRAHNRAHQAIERVADERARRGGRTVDR